MTSDRFSAAAAAEVLTAAGARAELLSSIVDVARAIFAAQAASVALLDVSEEAFVFEAVSGEGEERLVGTRFGAGEGLAGSVALTGEPTVIDHLDSDLRFARDFAHSTGYVPRAMMVAPLLRAERTLGVLSVLDRGNTGRSALEELQLLVRFADQAAVALELSDAARRASHLLADNGDPDVELVVSLVRSLVQLPGKRRDASMRLLSGLKQVLDS